MMRESFARFLDDQSSTARVRIAAEKGGFDPELWQGLAELGAFGLRVPEDFGGLGLGLMDAAVLLEEAGRTLVSGPLAEALVAARVLATLGGDTQGELLERVIGGEAVLSIAFHDVATTPLQWVAGGAVAEAVIARDGDKIVFVTLPVGESRSEDNLASTPIAELKLDGANRTVLSENAEGRKVFAQAIEEWKLLMSVALSGLARESVRLAAAYACEREAFGQKIGTYQAMSHPLADLITDVDGGKYLAWKAIHDIAKGLPEGGLRKSPWRSGGTPIRPAAP